MSCPCDWITIKEYLETTGKNMWLDVDCGKEWSTVDIVLSHIRPYIYLLPWMMWYKEIDVNKSVIQTDNNDYIYKVDWFFGKWCTDCIEEDDNWCWWCCDWFGRIKMREMSWVPVNLLWTWEYLMECRPTNTIHYKLPCWVKQAYVRYYKYFKRITNENQCLPIPRYLYPAFQMIMLYYTSFKWNIHQWEDVKFMNDFSNFIQQTLNQFKDEVPTDFKVKYLSA